MNFYIRLIQFFNHILFSLYVLNNNWKYFDISFILTGFFFYIVILCLGVSVGFHRLFTHKTFKTAPLIEMILLFLGTIATLGSSISWSGTHLYHHANSDTNKDTHSPTAGHLKIWFGLWPKILIPFKYVSHLSRQKNHRFFHNNYFLILFLYIGVLFLFFGLKGFIYLYCLPSILCFHATSAVNVLAHSNKKKHEITKDFSKNLTWLSLLTFGEGYHLNHHQDPNKSRFGKWDLGYLFISLIKI